MSDVTPPGQVFGAAAGQAAPVGVPGAIVNPPPAVGGLAVGTILRGVVLSQDVKGHAVVQTDRGTLVVSSALALASGSQVALQVRAAGSQLLIAILQVDGHPVHQAPHHQAPADKPGQSPPPLPAAQPPGHGPTPPPAAAPAPADPSDRLSLGQTLRAVVQAAAPPAAAGAAPGPGTTPPATPPTTLPPLAAGTRLQVVVRQVLPPATGTVPAPAAAPALAPTAAPTAAPAAAPTAAPAAPAGGLPIEALVTGSTGRGQPVLQTALGTLTLNLEAALPQGTRLLLAVAPADLAGHRPLQAQPPASPAALAYHWPALAEAVEVLQVFEAETRPDGAAPQPFPATRNLAQPGPRLASTMLFFLQALGGGQLGGWLGGRAAEALERAGRSDLLGRLGQDFAQLARLSDSAGGEWRFLPLPFYDGQELHQLRFFLRRHGDGGGGRDAAAPEAGDPATRFVLDVDNSRFGELQLDGLVRDKRFDLILRSRRALPEAMRRDIAGIFAEANGATGGAGQIGFQASSDWQALTLTPGAPGAHIAPGLVV